MSRLAISIPVTLTIALVACAHVATAAPATNESASQITANDAYDAVLDLWKKGHWESMRPVLDEAVKTFDGDTRLAFFSAVDQRSVFAIEAAETLFQRVIDIGPPEDPYVRAAAAMIALDARREAKTNFAVLDKLLADRPDDPLLLWSLGIQCRSYDQAAVGVRHYERLFKILGEDGGTAIVHQTYANLLDDVGRCADALPHRDRAIALADPRATWPLQGKANTLSHLRRFKEADELYERITLMAPNRSLYWKNWAWSMQLRGDWAGVVEKYQRAAALEPDAPASLWNGWGDAERKLGRPTDALERYERAMKAAPNDPAAYAKAAEIHAELGDESRAAELRAKSKSLAALNTRPQGD